MWAGSTAGPAGAAGQLPGEGDRGWRETTRQPLAVKRDPRLAAVPTPTCRSSSTWRTEISERVSRGATRPSSASAASRRRCRTGQGGGAKDAEVDRGGRRAGGQLTDIEGEIYQWRNQSSQDPLNFPIKLNNKLAALQGVVESRGRHGRPPRATTVFKELAARLDAEMAKLDAAGEDRRAGVQPAACAQEAAGRHDRMTRRASTSAGCGRVPGDVERAASGGPER